MKFIETLQNYMPFDTEDAKSKQFIIDFYKKYNGNIFTRDNLEGHMCTGVWVVNPNRTKVLMAYHNIHDSFAWFGGHADGDDDLANVARKELMEESGLINFRALSDDVFLTVLLKQKAHVRKGKNVSEHLHPIFVYLFEADENEETRPQPGENASVKWLDLKNLDTYLSEEEKSIALPVYKRILDKMVKTGI